MYTFRCMYIHVLPLLMPCVFLLLLHFTCSPPPPSPLLTGLVSTIYGSGAAGLQNGEAGQVQFHSPQGLVLNGDSLYVADTENHVIRKVHTYIHVHSIMYNYTYIYIHAVVYRTLCMLCYVYMVLTLSASGGGGQWECELCGRDRGTGE